MSQTYPERSEVKVCDPVLSAKNELVFSDAGRDITGSSQLVTTHYVRGQLRDKIQNEKLFVRSKINNKF